MITTIGTAFIVRGISYSFTQGLPIYPLPPEVGIVGSWRPFGTSFTFLAVLVLVVVVQILLSRTRSGSSLYATGGNKIAAQICGINTDRVKVACFMVTSFLAGLAGMLTMSQLPRTPGDPIIGKNLELDILAGVVIGGVSFFGGRGSAVGTFFGVMFIQLVQSGLVIAGFDSYSNGGARLSADDGRSGGCAPVSAERKLSLDRRSTYLPAAWLKSLAILPANQNAIVQVSERSRGCSKDGQGLYALPGD